MNLNMPPVGISGRYRMVVSTDAEMKNIKQELEFNNLITDVGMDRIGTVNTNSSGSSYTSFSSLCGGFSVGSGSSTPNFTDTSLQTQVAYSGSSGVSSTSSYSAGYSEVTMTTQFGQGVAQGNLSEIGIQDGSSGPLWSRALILDGLGSPTTITVRETDFLTCFYTLRIAIPMTDATFNINVDYGDEGIVPTVVTIRPLSTESESSSSGWGLQTVGLSGSGGRGLIQFYTGGLSIPTATNPLGSSLSLTADVTPLVYIPGTHEREVMRTFGLGENNSNQLATAKVQPLMGCWQVNFDPPLQKNNTQTMDITFGYSWARA